MVPPRSRISPSRGKLEWRIASETARRAALVQSWPWTSTPIPNSRTSVRGLALCIQAHSLRRAAVQLGADWPLLRLRARSRVSRMTRAYRFVHVDVFTDHIFGGNQLAVFLEPSGLSDEEMQSIAREMNFAETTFVFP